MSHSFATLEVSAYTYDEIDHKLRDAGYEHAILESGAIDMHGIGISRDKSEMIKLFGISYALELFKHLGLGPVGHCFRIMSRRDGVLTLQDLHELRNPTDEDLRRIWKDAGGSFHGRIIVEHGSIEEAKLFVLLRRLISPATKVETGWLVANGHNPPNARYRFMDETGYHWTKDIGQAIRFARRADAEQFCASDEDAWSIQEHTFLSAVT